MIFRMYFDGFPEDRNIVLSHSSNFINNIMLVIHFEMMLASLLAHISSSFFSFDDRLFRNVGFVIQDVGVDMLADLK